MKEPIPSDINKKHVLEAIERFDSGVKHNFADSTRYDLVHEGKRYPPKAILGLAAELAGGRQLGPGDFKGGVGSKCFRVLTTLGFSIQLKAPLLGRFVVGKTYNRRKDIHENYGGQQQGGICTPTDIPAIFLFTGQGGEDFGYNDGWDDAGIFRLFMCVFNQEPPQEPLASINNY
ncbi:MAG: hypothetical protein P4N60_02300 [Verrucomicrobiae bacterium]|nr:hypothetical protein [Verrucomicrobiae bacterium]